MMMAVTRQTQTKGKMKTKYLRTAYKVHSNFVKKNDDRSSNSSYVHTGCKMSS